MLSRRQKPNNTKKCDDNTSLSKALPPIRPKSSNRPIPSPTIRCDLSPSKNTSPKSSPNTPATKSERPENSCSLALKLDSTTANAKTSYDAASLSQQDDIKVYAKLGQVELLLNDAKFADAIAILDEIMAKHPGMSAFATLEKGRIHEMAGETDKAIAAYALVSRELGKDSDKTLAMSRLKYLTKDWETYITPAVPAQNNVPQAAL